MKTIEDNYLLFHYQGNKVQNDTKSKKKQFSEDIDKCKNSLN